MRVGIATRIAGTRAAVAAGAIGRIVCGNVWWCGDVLAVVPRAQGENDADYLVHNWPNFVAISGDFIVEQGIHSIDVANWFCGGPPVAAAGFGGRTRRRTGDQFDFFSVDFEYPGGAHVHAMCRQIRGCWNRLDEEFMGTGGEVRPRLGLRGVRLTGDGKEPTVPDFPEHRGGSYVQEFVDLLRGMFNGPPPNEAQSLAESTLAALMGRISAYTGLRVEARQLIDPDAKSEWYGLQLRPTAADFETGQVKAPPDDVAPVPGRA